MIAIGFSTTSAFTSRFIRWRTKTPELAPEETPSHAWILHEAYGAQYVMGAEWNGFSVISFEHFQKVNRVIAVVPVCDRMRALGKDARARVFEAAEWLGDSYDWWGLLRFVVPKLIKGQSPHALLCSEAVVRAFQDLFPGIDPETSSPARLLVELRKHS